MRTAVLFALALAAVPTPALAQVFVGRAEAVDGDTLDMTGTRIRLFGIDAVESGQTCLRGGEAWACGADARALLGELVAGQMIACEQRDTDVYGRVVGICRVGRVDLSGAMASGGFAIALDEYSQAYRPAADGARARQAGIWDSEFVAPAEWRAANPRSEQPLRRVERQATAPPAAVARPAPAAGRYFRNCAEAIAAGAAPLYRGQPGYRPQMDGDSDGIACEPYRGRR